MPPENEPSHPEILTLRERLGSVERDVREVDQRVGRLDQKLDDQMRSSISRHTELMGSIGMLTKTSELADQRLALQTEGILSTLKETGKRVDTIETSRVDELKKLLDERNESGKHWVRYVIASLITVGLGVGGWIAGHYLK